jgi:hypothetical protein
VDKTGAENLTCLIIADKKVVNNINTAVALLRLPASTRITLTLWHAFLLLGLRVFPLFFFLLGGLHCLFLLEFV